MAKRGRNKGDGIKMTPELEDSLLEFVAEGGTVSQWCRDNDVGRVTVYDHKARDDNDFADRFARARLTGYDAWADKVIDLSGKRLPTETVTTEYDPEGNVVSVKETTSDNVARTRLQTQNYKDLLARVDPDRYGDRMRVETLSKDEMAAQVTAYLEKARKAKESEDGEQGDDGDGEVSA